MTARLLDLTRLVSRAGRPFTGVDRVEYAYLSRLASDGPLYGLVRTGRGFLLLDMAGCAALTRLLDSGDLPAPDLLSRLRGRDAGRAGAERALRRVAVGRCLPRGLGRLLERHLPQGAVYINVGHTRLSDVLLSGLGANRKAVLLHDTIPLDHPEFTRSGITERFKEFLGRVEAHADVVICNSRQTEADLHRHMTTVPRCVVAPLGIDVPKPGSAPAGPWDGGPWFVILGTIEPRKNHALLLRLWQEGLVPNDAHLLICGARGWNNAAVFDTLDRGIPRVHELPGLPDGAIAVLLKGSAGMLFPSLAEGYGLPPAEAAALGVPLLCNDLKVLREVVGDIPVYAPVADAYLWASEITRMAEERRADPARAVTRSKSYAPPDWDAHFKTVLTEI